ncbi:MAG: hypothetical protein ACE5OY_04770 [Candidatus Bathyarchaeia archaeon]
MIEQDEPRQLEPTRIGMAWFSLFIIGDFSNAIEGFFFTTLFLTATAFLGSVILLLLLNLIEAVPAGVLFTPARACSSLKTELREYFKRDHSSRGYGGLPYVP